LDLSWGFFCWWELNSPHIIGSADIFRSTRSEFGGVSTLVAAPSPFLETNKKVNSPKLIKITWPSQHIGDGNLLTHFKKQFQNYLRLSLSFCTRIAANSLLDKNRFL
jgi:hypothetical protein